MRYLYCKENCNDGEGHNKEQHHKNTNDILHGIIHYTVDLNDAVLQTVEVSTLSNNEVETNINEIIYCLCHLLCTMVSDGKGHFRWEISQWKWLTAVHLGRPN